MLAWRDRQLPSERIVVLSDGPEKQQQTAHGDNDHPRAGGELGYQDHEPDNRCCNHADETKDCAKPCLQLPLLNYHSGLAKGKCREYTQGVKRYQTMRIATGENDQKTRDDGQKYDAVLKH